MVNRDIVERQLKRIGCNFQMWGRGEANELRNVLMDGETLAHCVNGHYTGGFAMLCATDHRVLLIDKKPMSYLHVEDVRFEMISEFDYSHRLLNATVHIYATTKTLSFTSWNHHQLRSLLSYIQQRVIEIRQYYYMAQQFQTTQQPQLQQPTYVPNMALQMPWGGQQAPQQPTKLANASQALGAYTYAKLPHLRRRNSRHLGEYALPDEVYQAPLRRTTW
jgi:hypothetical protein